MTGCEEILDACPESQARHRRVLDMLRRQYNQAVMNNTHRAEYVECLIASELGPDWELMWERGRDWAGWDCQHTTSEGRIEIKQSAARQSWDLEALAPRRSPRFDIAPRTRYWTEQGGGRWVDHQGRPADLYVFAWHDKRRDGDADHRNAGQWFFFVVAEQDLPRNQKSLGLTGLRAITSPCRIADLARAVRNACPEPDALKAARGF